MIINIKINEQNIYRNIDGYEIAVNIYGKFPVEIIVRKMYGGTIKTWKLDESGLEGQPFGEIVYEFYNFCKNRDIKARLVG